MVRGGHVLDNNTVLEMRNITKKFPGVKALNKVNLNIKNGEVHALLGENGAGKSTLMKILAGIHIADEGEVIFNGEKITFRTPQEANEKGILLIHQELSLVNELSIAENIFLGSLPKKYMNVIDKAELKERSRKALDRLDCQFSVDELVGNLTVAQQQMVEIARALVYDPKLIIFDEPTASLTETEKEVLFKNIRQFKEQGIASIYISHRLEEIMEITDRITVLRDGEKTGERITKNITQDDIVELMIGRKINKELTDKLYPSIGKEVIKVNNITSGDTFKNISFSISEGEILGLYGLIGAGRTEVAESIFGIRKINSGDIYFGGKEQKIPNSNKAVKLGIGFVPENRKEQGLVLEMSCKDNMTLASLDKVSQLGVINSNKEKSTFNEYEELLSISTPGLAQPVINLSGGNQQKIVIGKWINSNPKLLILDEPTRGIDIGSKTEIHKLIYKLASQGFAILVISSEMLEIMAVSHKVITMYEGQVTGEFHDEEITEANLIRGISGLERIEEKV